MSELKSLGLDKITSTDLSREYKSVSEIVNNSPKPLEIMKNGKVDMVVMNPKLFRRIMELIEDFQDNIAILEYEVNKEKMEFILTKKAFYDVDSGEYSEMSIDELLSQ